MEESKALERIPFIYLPTFIMDTIMLTIRRFRERTPEEMQKEMDDRSRTRSDF
jgi:hypothetical protein